MPPDRFNVIDSGGEEPPSEWLLAPAAIGAVGDRHASGRAVVLGARLR